MDEGILTLASLVVDGAVMAGAAAAA